MLSRLLRRPFCARCKAVTVAGAQRAKHGTSQTGRAKTAAAFALTHGTRGKTATAFACVRASSSYSFQPDKKNVYYADPVVSPQNHDDPVATEERKSERSFVDAEQQGLSDFLKRMYKYSGAGITGSLAIATALSSCEPSLPLLGLSIGLTFGGVIGISACKYTVHETRHKTITEKGAKITSVYHSTNGASRVISYGALSTGIGLVMAPLVGSISHVILPASLVITSCIFAGSSAYAYWRPRGSLLRYEAPLFGGLCGLVGLQLIGLGALFAAGPNVLSEVIHSADVYGGLLLFSALTAVETQRAVKMYEQKDPDHLGCAVSLYLDFMNILIRVMQAMAEKKKQSK